VADQGQLNLNRRNPARYQEEAAEESLGSGQRTQSAANAPAGVLSCESRSDGAEAPVQFLRFGATRSWWCFGSQQRREGGARDRAREVEGGGEWSAPR